MSQCDVSTGQRRIKNIEAFSTCFQSPESRVLSVLHLGTELKTTGEKFDCFVRDDFYP